MTESFRVPSGFCSQCGSVLPPIGLSTSLTCYQCKKTIDVRDFGRMKSEYTMSFNTLENVNIAKKKKNIGDAADGPIVERICKKCGHNQMSYAAMQLRSADEGQTVFFTCVKCKFTESENS